MRFLGIDYGSKRVGIAVSDERNKVAFPKIVLANDGALIDSIESLVEKNDVSTIVLGESKDGNGADNPIMSDVRDFKVSVEEKLKIPVVFEPEFFTSVQAERQGKTPMLDASAAALILQSYLDKHNNSTQS